MKLFYAALFLVFTLHAFGQDPPSRQDSKNEGVPGFKLYPNPVFDDVVYITTDRNAQKTVAIYDVFGEVVLRDVIKNNILNISDLVPGVYVLQVMEAQKTSTRKLVVK
ncbi:T9SS type A sorting domain-containing protein [Flavobacteriaceae bacterium TP-CH-4]|uniref:T9SS type A sorting domain-containing protein n=1 Tax=Pelagihabitans pacificus TaxID=2696054 RepID=A0A967AQT3_9FLAO|nr:T9SS type A sorting domain-containing protein [Pelagihabitans pacificus]NHF58664.1 T9SS type A sorting domain-containing protein [Pelagihabitans pacificus]